MKLIVRFMVIVLALSFVLPGTFVGAQDEEVSLPTTPEISAVYYLTASGGSFADQGDGTYLLTLEGVAPQVEWIMVSPSLALQSHDTLNLADQWAANAELSTNAVIEAEGLNIEIDLTAPTYDAGTQVQTFVATVTNIVAPEDVKEPEVPAAFGASTLSIAWSIEFQGGLLGGIDALYEGVRATPEQCADCKAKVDYYNSTWLPPKKAEHDSLVFPCITGNKAACTRMGELSSEMASEQLKLSTCFNILSKECPKP